MLLDPLIKNPLLISISFEYGIFHFLKFLDILGKLLIKE